jgi:predicted transcriptional regulator
MCSSCGDPIADLLDVLRKQTGPARLKQVLARLAADHPESAELLDDDTRKEKVLKHLKDNGTVSFTKVGARDEIYVTLARDPDEHDTADAEGDEEE